MNKTQPIFFIGIKGTGMAALACMLHDMGYTVSGSDLTRHFFTEEPLIQRNIPIYPFDTHRIEDGSMVIIGNAFGDDFKEVANARNNPHLSCLRYHEFLGHFMQGYTSFSVAGSHGKTTTTGMLQCMLNALYPTGYIIGDGTGHMHEQATHFVLESCEFRRHFLAYHPQYAIITNMDLDHVDYFRDEADYRHAYEQFAAQCGQIVACGDDPNVKVADLGDHVVTYGFEPSNDYVITIAFSDATHTVFMVKGDNKRGTFDLPFVGNHLILDCTACIVMGWLIGMDNTTISNGLHQFHGEKRRFVVETVADSVIVDDYAHHPTEISVTIDAAKARFPHQKIVAVYKPHRASRIVYFRDQFVKALTKADKVYVCEFTSIDDQDDPRCTSISYLSEHIDGCTILSEDQKGGELLAKEAPCVYLFLSSKDIYHLEDHLKTALKR